MQKQTFSAKALGNEYATGVSRPAVLTTKIFLPHLRATTEGKRMDVGNKFRCTGKWNDECFDRVIEAEDEGDARDHWMYWAWAAGATLQNLEVTVAA